MKNFPSIPFRPIVLFLLFFLILTSVYSPILYFNYVFHDDALFWTKLKEFGFKHYLHDELMTECRYGYAVLLDIENFFVHKVSDLKFFRFLAIVISSCNACLLWRQMRRLSFPDIQAFLVISAMFFLPGFAVIFLGASYSYIVALTVFLATWSFYRIESSKGIVIPVFIFLVAIMIYPPAAMFYWVMTGMNILFIRDRFSAKFRNDLLRFMIVGLIGLLIYIISIILMHYFFPPKILYNLYNPYAITSDWSGKLQWFFQEPMGNVLNLWNIFPKITTSIIVFGFIALTLLIVALKQFKKIEPHKRKSAALTCFWQLILFIFVFFLTFLPNLASKGNAAYYRCLIPLSSLVWLILYWAILQWMDIIPIILTRRTMIALLSFIVVYAGIKTYDHVLHYRVLPGYVEFNAYRSMAEKIHFRKVNAIHLIIPYHLSIERYDEFGDLSSYYADDIYHLLHCAFEETQGQGRYSIPLVYVSYPDDNRLIELQEIYIKKLPNGKWVGRDFNKDSPFQEINPSGIIDAFDGKLIYTSSPQKMFSKRQDWYNLNLNDFFSPSNYNYLIERH